MTGVRQIIENVSKTALRNKNFNKVVLEDIITRVVGCTTRAQMLFRADVGGYTHSAVTAKEMKIRIAKDVAAFKIIFRIQLIGFEEVWEVHLFVKSNDSPKQIDHFFKEIKNCSVQVCAEVNKAHTAECELERLTRPDHETCSAEDQQVGDECDIVTGNAVNSSRVDSARNVNEYESGTEKKKRRSAVATVTSSVIVEILTAWFHYNNGGSLYQRELWRIIEPLKIDLNKVLLLNFLKNRHIVNVRKQRYNPIIEMTENGVRLHQGAQRHKASEDHIDQCLPESMVSGSSDDQISNTSVMVQLKKLNEDLCCDQNAEQVLLERNVQLHQELADNLQKIADLRESQRRIIDELSALISGSC